MFNRTLRAAWLVVALAITVQGQQGETVVVRPVEIQDVLVNPGMGIQTFQRFNGDRLNEALGWSEEGPTATLAAAEVKPDFPGSSISYCRWFWETLEPEHGKVRWEILDNAFVEARRHGQALAIRLMPYDQKHPLPELVSQLGLPARQQADGQGWRDLAAGLQRS